MTSHSLVAFKLIILNVFFSMLTFTFAFNKASCPSALATNCVATPLWGKCEDETRTSK
ncbi:unnamed protein product, partial [Sphagnum balticum]